jgi:hypothetical protein
MGHEAAVVKIWRRGVGDPARARVKKKTHWALWQHVTELYREGSVAAAKEIIRLATECEDERVRSVCANWVIERAWGKPKEYDPDKDKEKGQVKFDPKLYTFEELEVLYKALTLMASKQGQAPGE